ncbi:hypothetical protein [Massilia sp. S19_KUP03_FR1]
MGNSLHNKIYLGRHGAFGARLVQRALLVAAIVGMALAWLLVSG